jgi:hypothetical protein
MDSDSTPDRRMISSAASTIAASVKDLAVIVPPALTGLYSVRILAGDVAAESRRPSYPSHTFLVPLRQVIVR